MTTVDAAKYAAGIQYLEHRRQMREDRAHAWADPVWFVNEYLGRPTFDKQDEIAESVKEHRRTAVKGANGSGKDYESGNLVPWWEFCWDDAIVIVSGPTLPQAHGSICRAARRAWA